MLSSLMIQTWQDMWAFRARAANASLVAVLLLGTACGGGASGASRSFPLRLGHDRWDINQVTLSPSGSSIAVSGDPPGGTAMWAVGVRALDGGTFQRLSPQNQFVGDAAWVDAHTLVISFGTVSTQRLAKVSVSDGHLDVLPSLGEFGHEYRDGMAVSPDHHQVAITVTPPGTTTYVPTAILVVDLTTGVSRAVVPTSAARPRMPSSSSDHQLLYMEDANTGTALKVLDLSASTSSTVDTHGYRIYDVSADRGIVAFDGLDPHGDQALFATRLDAFSPRQIESGSYSMPSVNASAGLLASVATGSGPADAGDVVVDRLPF